MRRLTATYGSLPILVMGLVAATAEAGPRYQQANLFGSGYAETQVAPGTWDVRGASATPDGGHAIALYRAAELARAAGATELRVIRQKITVTSRTDRSGIPIMFIREVAKLRVRAVLGEADRRACEEKEAQRCVTVPVARLLAQFGPSLGQGSASYTAAARPVVRVGPTLPAAFLEQLAYQASARAAAAPASPAPTRQLSPYELGRQQGRAALAAAGERVDD